MARMSFDIVGAESAELPAERAELEFLGAAQSGFHGMGHHLIQRRIGDKERGNDAGMGGIGASQFQRGGRAVRLRIAGIGRQFPA